MLTENKAIIICIMNMKYKIRQWQYLFFSLGFPIMFTLLFYFFLGAEIFKYSFPGMVIYTTAAGTPSAAIAFSVNKTSGMLERLDTMPTGRKNIFLGALISETIVNALQIIIIFILGYIILQIPVIGVIELLIGFFVALMFGISSVGIGIIIASISKTPEVANAIALFYYLPMMFLSGALFPFESPIVFFTPPFWAKQIYLQITVLGNGLFEKLYSSSMIGVSAELTSIPLWGGILITIAYTIGFTLIGILIFQKKTRQ